eukprot:gene13677-4581_t
MGVEGAQYWYYPYIASPQSNSRACSLLVCCAVQILSLWGGAGAVLHSRFLQPGHGIIKEIWYNTPELELDAYRKLKDFPACPHMVQNLDHFEDPMVYISAKQKFVIARYKGYFVPSETGNHRFYAKCKGMCTFTIEAHPFDMRKILEVQHATSYSCWDCTASQKSREIFLYKSVRYYVEFMRVGDGNNDFAALGVRKPSGITERPIKRSSLWRTLSLYNWHGLLGEYYNIAPGTRPDLGSTAASPKERTIFSYRDVFSSFQSMGRLQSGNKYFLRINYFKDDKGGTRFFVKRMQDLTTYEFFQSTETRTINSENELIPAASYQVVNSTSVNITWGVPWFPLYNNFTLKFYHIRFSPLDNPTDVHESKITDLAITSKVFSGLGIWTIHAAKVWYIGDEYTIRPKDLIFRTGEGVPSAPPSRINLQASTSTSIVVAWGPIPFRNQHGALIGFIIKYSLKGEGNWLNVTSNTIVVREKTLTGLNKYRGYDIRIAGMTSAGVGVFSSIFTQRTLEDAPTLPPTNISAHNLSSRALEVNWGTVPLSGRNGIVRVYVIYYKLKDSPESDWQYTKASGSVKTIIITSLRHWSIYQIKVAAKTIREGTKSEAVIARTDEYAPSGSPRNVTGTAIASDSFHVSWTEIPYKETNGVIMKYFVTYKETEGYARWQDAYTTKMNILITGVEEYFNYTIRVAGVTSKGIGVLSQIIYVKTKQDVPSAPAEAIRAVNTSANSLLVSWQPVPYRHQNGVILGYSIAYRANDTMEWKNATVDDNQMKTVIHGLRNYTWYEIKVAGITKIGVGKYNAPILGITDENVPSAPPSNFWGNNVTSRSIILFWNQISLKNRNGIINGYRVIYKEDSEGINEWLETSFSSNSRNGTVDNLKMFQSYFLRIAGITSKGVGVFSNSIKVWTDEDSPEGYPMNISGFASTSTALSLSWNSKQSNESNGIIIAYSVFYQVVKCPADMPSWCSETRVMSTKTKNNTNHFVLTGLKKFVEYYVWIRVLNKMGTGPPSPKFRIKTATDIPAGAPRMLESFSRDFNSISLYWDPIKESERNGIVIAYRIFYRRQDKQVLKTHRVVRAVSGSENNTVEGLLPGESYKDVKGNFTTAVVDNLEPYRWYIIRVAGMTKAGLGPISVVNASCGQDVAIIGPSFEIYDRYSYSEISVSWSAIASFNQTRGTVLEYNVKYWPVEFEMKPSLEPKVTSLMVKVPMTSAKLTGLKLFTKYAVKVAAVTQTGIGAYTDTLYGETCRCEKEVHIVKRILVPLITKETNDTFTLLLDTAVKSCCSTCSSTKTQTDWEIDSHGEGILSPDDIFEELQHGKEVYAPQLQAIHTWSHLDRSHGIGKFVPVIRSPGIAVIARKMSAAEKANEGAKTLIRGLGRSYPVFVIALLVLVLYGHIHWLIELKTRENHLAGGFFNGLHQAIWFAFQSQLTTGYGDIVPLTFFGRIGAVASIVFGLIWKALLVSSITVTILQKTEEKPGVFSLVGKKVSVTNDTQQFAFRSGATISNVFSYKKYMKAIDTVLDGSVDMALIDGLSIIANDKIVNNDKLVIKDIKDENQFYGVVVSGKAERLANCINMYMRSNKQEIDRKMGINFHRLWKVVKSQATNEKVSYILSKDSTAFKISVITLMVVLVFAIICSLIYENRRRKTIFAKIGPLRSSPNKNGEDKLIQVDEFIKKIHVMTEELELKHAKQIIELSNKNYAVNIVPDIIELFGNADYEEDIRKHKHTVSLGLPKPTVAGSRVSLSIVNEKEEEV